MGTGSDIGDKVEQIVTEVKADPKSWWKSKTIWANVVAVIGVGIVAVTGWVDATTWAEISTVILGAVNVGLRLVTSEPVGK